MLENLPNYVSLVFVFTTFLTVSFFVIAAWQARLSKICLVVLSLVFVFLLIIHALLATSGFYLILNTTPPRFPLAPVPTTIALLILIFYFARKQISVRALQTLTLLHIVRVPVELVLFWLYQGELVPQLMTFEGRNFDILSGLTAPLMAWLAFRNCKTQKKVNRRWLIVWNLLALGLLINIVTHAILSLATPFQQFAFDQPNRGVLYFPFIWLPAAIVPVVFVSHVWSLWQLVFSQN